MGKGTKASEGRKVRKAGRGNDKAAGLIPVTWKGLRNAVLVMHTSLICLLGMCWRFHSAVLWDEHKHASRRVPSGVKEPRRPLTQPVMTLNCFYPPEWWEWNSCSVFFSIFIPLFSSLFFLTLTSAPKGVLLTCNQKYLIGPKKN